MKSFKIIIVGIVLASLASCNQTSSISGNVEDEFLSSPISGVKITASTSTDILEDKKFEKVTTKTDNEGKFVISGLSSKYSYTIIAEKEGYLSNWQNNISPPEEGKTKLLSSIITLAKSIPITGKIVDAKNNPLQNVDVSIKGKNHVTVTKADGLFEFPPLFGQIQLVVSTENYPNWCKNQTYEYYINN